MRQFISKYGVFLAAAMIVLAGLISYLASGGGPPRAPTQAYYIDDITGEESIQPASSIPPLNNKDGKPTLVQVIKISCEKPGLTRPSGKNAKVAYYRKMTMAAKQYIEQHANDPAHFEEVERARSEGELVRLPAKGSPWVRAITEEGDRVRQSVQCGANEQAYAVFP